MKKIIEKVKGLFKRRITPNIGVGFQPYVGPWVGGQPVLWNAYTPEQVNKLLMAVSKNFKRIATYGQGTFVWQGTPRIQDSNQYNISAAKKNGIAVSAGCALQGISGDSFNVDWSKCEVDYAVAQAKACGNVTDLIIGNESIFGPVSTGQLVTLMQYAKAQIKAAGLKIPVTTRQRWDVMAGVNNTTPGYATMRTALLALVAECDGFIYVNVYPYFDPNIAGAIGGAGATEAQFASAVLASFSGSWSALIAAWTAQNLMGTKIRIGETGWPTSGSQASQPAAWLASDKFAGWYYKAISKWMSSNAVTGYVFEAYDEPWKGTADGTSSEGHFGIWAAEGTATTPGQYMLTGEKQKYVPGT